MSAARRLQVLRSPWANCLPRQSSPKFALRGGVAADRAANRIMKTVAHLLAVVFGVLGLIFLVGAGQGNVAPRLIIGIILLGAAAFMIYFARSKGPEMKVTHKVDFTGETELQHLRCKSCGAQLSADAVEMKEGAIYVKCPYCGTAYQLEEKPKW